MSRANVIICFKNGIQEHVFEVEIIILVVLFVYTTDVTKHCYCVNRPEAPLVGPYCHDWDAWKEYHVPYCYLSGGPNGKYCRAPLGKSSRGDFYWTENENLCNRSKPGTLFTKYYLIRQNEKQNR